MKVVLITGGTSGIGEALARRAANADWQVAFTYRNAQDKAQKIVQELGSDKVQAFHLELNNPETISACVAAVAKEYGCLDALVLSASPGPILNPLWKQSSDDFLGQFRVNVIGNHHLMADCWKSFFKKQNRGHIVALLSSALGPPPLGHMSSYVIAKRSLELLLEYALVEYGKSGLRASAIVPTFTETPMLAGLNSHFVEMARMKNPSHQFLKPEQVAECIFQCLENPPATPTLSLRPVPLPAPAL